MYSKDKTELCYLQITPKENKRDNSNKPIKAKHKSSNPHEILRKERKKSSLLIEEKPKINGSHTFTFFPPKKSPLSRLPLSRVLPPLENPRHLPIPPRQPAWEAPTPPMGSHASCRLSASQAMHGKVPPPPSLLPHMSCKRRRRRNKLPRAPLTSKRVYIYLYYEKFIFFSIV